jgi:glycosyltransferase involved in cell wall biosynthesis
MKKILFMLYDMHAGGIEKSLTSFLNYIDHSSYSVTLLLINITGEHLKDIHANVKIESIKMPIELKLEILYGNKTSIFKLFKEKYFFKAIFQLTKVISYKLIRKKRDTQFLINLSNKVLQVREEMYDLAVDFQGLGSGVFSTFYISEKVRSNKKVTWIHQDISILKNDFDWVDKYFEKYDKIFSVSKQAQTIFDSKFTKYTYKSDVFYNLIPFESIKELSNSKIKVNNNNDSILILSVGRLAFQKGYDIALKVIKQLLDEKYNIKYLIIGEGEKRKELENLINYYELKNHVELLGFNSNPYPYMKVCDIYFQPSRFEGFCTTLTEAKVFSKPILTTNFAGAREQIINNETGLICEFDESLIYQALKKLLDSQVLREKLSFNLRNVLLDNKSSIVKLTDLI